MEFLDNARSKLRVMTVRIMEGKTPGRLIKIMSVQEVISSSPSNPIQAGNALAMSFPKARINSDEHEWKHGEECQVRMEMGEQSRIIRPDAAIDPAML